MPHTTMPRPQKRRWLHGSGMTMCATYSLTDARSGATFIWAIAMQNIASTSTSGYSVKLSAIKGDKQHDHHHWWVQQLRTQLSRQQ